MIDVKSLPDFKLTFDDLGEDMERYFDALLNAKLNGKELDGSPARLSGEEVLDAYGSKGLWLLIAKVCEIRGCFEFNKKRSEEFYGEEIINATDYDKELTEGLISIGELSEVKRLWRSAVKRNKREFWARYLLYLTEAPEALEEEVLNYDKPRLLVTCNNWLKYAQQLNYKDEIDWVNQIIYDVENEILPTPRNKKAEPTKIDESVFWEIIGQAIEQSDGTTDDTVEQITLRVEDFKLTEIKRFQNLLLDQLEVLNTWDCWALAYISQGGCSDDSFLYFRCWIILQGQDVVNLCITDIEKAMRSVPKDGDVYAEGLLSAADTAYNIRGGGKAMTIRQRKDKEPTGTEWDEDKVEEIYPRVTEYYS